MDPGRAPGPAFKPPRGLLGNCGAFLSVWGACTQPAPTDTGRCSAVPGPAAHTRGPQKACARGAEAAPADWADEEQDGEALNQL